MQPRSGDPTKGGTGHLTRVAGFDMIYALQDVDFDHKQGLYSVPAKFGEPATLPITRGLHFLAVLCWLAAGLLGGMGLCYWVGLVLVGGFLIREHHLVRAFGVANIAMFALLFLIHAKVKIYVFHQSSVWSPNLIDKALQGNSILAFPQPLPSASSRNIANRSGTP